MNLSLVIASGLLLGFAGSFHCAGYCGAIASSLALAAPNFSRSRVHLAGNLLAPHIGRVAVYTAFGMAAGSAVDSVATLGQLTGFRTFTVVMASFSLIWAAAVALGWIPETLGPSRLLGRLIKPAAHALGGRSLLPLGFAWGCAPCGMVYSALLNASLTGSLLGGGLLMLGFGLATLPLLLMVGAGQIAAQSLRLKVVSAYRLKTAAGCLLALLMARPMRRPPPRWRY